MLFLFILFLSFKMIFFVVFLLILGVLDNFLMFLFKIYVFNCVGDVNDSIESVILGFILDIDVSNLNILSFFLFIKL